jgi:hypothetical protein
MHEIHTDFVIAAPLAVNQPQPAYRVIIARTGAAEVDHRGQLLLVL